MNISASMKTVDNGVNVEALLGARTALAEMPEAAEFTWRANCEWMGGVHSRSTVEGFFGLGEEKAHRQPFVFEADHPAGVASVAQNRGIQLRSVRATVEGDMSLYGILGIDADVRNGFNAIRVSFDIDADATRDEIAAVVAQSQKRSAVFDIITNPGNVKVVVN